MKISAQSLGITSYREDRSGKAEVSVPSVNESSSVYEDSSLKNTFLIALAEDRLSDAAVTSRLW